MASTNDKTERDADLIEQIERRLGMGHAAWDTIDPLEIAAAFREALAAPAEGDGAVACKRCKGRGVIDDNIDVDDYGGLIGTIEPCPACQGNGAVAFNVTSNSEYLRNLAALLQQRGLGDAALPLSTIAAHYEELGSRPAATAQVPNDTTRAFRALTLKYQKHFDRAQFPDSFWSDLLAAAPAAPKGGVVRHELCDCPNGRAEHSPSCAALATGEQP